MKITANNKEYSVPNNTNLELFLDEYIELKNKSGIAVAINEVVIPKEEWSEETLQENDRVLLIKATQGG